MPSVETEAIVLRTYDLSDADRIVVLLTSDHGLKRTVAKGAKRLKSRFGSAIEPFSIIRAEYFQKENAELATLARADIVSSSFEMAANDDFLRHFSHLSRLLMAMVPADDPNEKIFRMVRACIMAVRDVPASIEAVSLYFKIWLLRLSGLLPEWGICSICRNPFGDTVSVQVTADNRIICDNCRRSDGGLKVSAAERSLPDLTRSIAPLDFARQIDERNIRYADLNRAIDKMIERAVGSEFYLNAA